MNSIKNLKRLLKLHQLIENEVTGSPKELAKKFGISERSVYCLLEELKDYEALIEYDRKRKTYYYKDDFKLFINISISVLSSGITTTSFRL
ncbi:MAG: DNA-binding protein [Muricauda sp.]|nr:HTH domain-containing protein [Allomuricauda sp.]MBC30758.1 DNA-binding protein [Allomuricauda sp.]